jgi:hypothetical protein
MHLKDPMVLIFLKNQMVKIKKINEVYGGPSIILVHLRHLELKIDGKDHYD